MAALVAVALAARSLIRRRGRFPALPGPSIPEPVVAAEPVTSGATGARLTVAFRPVRAGLNLLSATVEGEITLTNAGDRPAAAIRVEARLLSAHAEQDVEIAAMLSEGPVRPATVPFDLEPGATRHIAVVAVLPHEAIRTYPAGGREMFVPLVAVSAHFRSEDAPHRSGQAFAVGIERVDSAKLAPFWLDTGSRMHTEVAARPHGVLVER